MFLLFVLSIIFMPHMLYSAERLSSVAHGVIISTEPGEKSPMIKFSAPLLGGTVLLYMMQSTNGRRMACMSAYGHDNQSAQVNHLLEALEGFHKNGDGIKKQQLYVTLLQVKFKGAKYTDSRYVEHLKLLGKISGIKAEDLSVSIKCEEGACNPLFLAELTTERAKLSTNEQEEIITVKN